MQRLPYLNRCIKECLRLHTPVPFAVRSAAEDFELEGYTIPKGTDISANIYMLHHNETVWGDDHMVCMICHGFFIYFLKYHFTASIFINGDKCVMNKLMFVV